MTQVDARQRILQKLRNAHVEPMACPDASHFYAPSNEDQATRVERLMLTMKNAMAEVHRTSAADLSEMLVQICRDKQIQLLAVGPELITDQALCDAVATQTSLLPITEQCDDRRPLFEQADAGLTLTYAGIAETGTLVLWCGAQSPRQLSLVPPLHIAILHASRVVDRLMTLIIKEDWAAGLPTNVILISSPSKTADIQQTLAYGAHGPKQLVVILVEDR